MVVDRAFILEHLAKAEEHVVLGQEHVAHQRQLAEQLEHDGHDATAARAPLSQFEGLLAMHIKDRDRLVRELTDAPE